MDNLDTSLGFTLDFFVIVYVGNLNEDQGGRFMLLFMTAKMSNLDIK